MAGRNWKTSIIRPGISPLENLAGGIAELIRDKDKFKPEEEYLLTKSLKTNNEALRRASLNYLKNDLGFNSLLIIDNFEDLFHFKNVGNNPLFAIGILYVNRFLKLVYDSLDRLSMHAVGLKSLFEQMNLSLRSNRLK